MSIFASLQVQHIHRITKLCKWVPYANNKKRLCRSAEYAQQLYGKTEIQKVDAIWGLLGQNWDEQE